MRSHKYNNSVCSNHDHTIHSFFNLHLPTGDVEDNIKFPRAVPLLPFPVEEVLLPGGCHSLLQPHVSQHCMAAFVQPAQHAAAAQQQTGSTGPAVAFDKVGPCSTPNRSYWMVYELVAAQVSKAIKAAFDGGNLVSYVCHVSL